MLNVPYMFCCWAQSETGAGAAGQVAWAGQPQRAAILSPVRSLLQQAGCRCKERHHPPGAALLRHAAMVLRRQGGFPLHLTSMAILTPWCIDVCVLGLCAHSLPSNHDAEIGRHGCRNELLVSLQVRLWA